jgi:prepilin-type N-terminal cleavage/methylation domain-containing protein
MHFYDANTQRTWGWSLTELLCVMVIISIVAALYLGVIAKAFIHVKKFLEGM